MPSVFMIAGLPPDVREVDVAELLYNEPMKLSPTSLRVTGLYDHQGRFLGSFLVECGSVADAERVRANYSGQIIDRTHRIQVNHVLPADTAYPSSAPVRAIPAFGAPSAEAQAARQPPTGPKRKVQQMQQQQQQPQKAQQQQQQQQKAQQPQRGQPAKKEDGKPEGLKLLGRMGKPGRAGEKERQKLLLEKQRAALKGKRPGDALLSRLKASPAKAGAKKGPGAKGAAAKGADKVARAKKGGQGQKMDVDKQPKQQPKQQEAKPKPKTQEQLDEEMRAYERARRFAAA